MIHALVGGRTAQRAAGFTPWTELDISGGVEGIESIGQCGAAAIPAGVQMGMRFAEDREQRSTALGSLSPPISAAQVMVRPYCSTKASQRSSVSSSPLSPQTIGAVTTRTGTRAAREVHGEGHFVGKFLENDVVVDVFEHDEIEERDVFCR